MKLRNCILILLIASPLVVLAQEPSGSDWLEGHRTTPLQHSFFDQTNLRLQGTNLLSETMALLFHETGHHKLERWVPVVAISHAQASTGYALTGSSQGKYGW